MPGKIEQHEPTYLMVRVPRMVVFHSFVSSGVVLAPKMSVVLNIVNGLQKQNPDDSRKEESQQDLEFKNVIHRQDQNDICQ